MFQNLTDRLTTTIKNLRGQGRLSEDNIKDTLREVRMALLEADVALPVVKEFTEKVRERAVGQEVLQSLTPGQALVIEGRWPEDCRSANVCLWNRHMQTLDYLNRQVTLNRRQTRLEPDGSYRIVVAHEDPGLPNLPNWLDTEGRGFGLVFFRFMLPEGDIETPRAQLVSVDALPRT